jgi:hypothetical protein
MYHLDSDSCMKLIHSNVYRLPLVLFTLYSRCSHLGLDLDIVCHASTLISVDCNGDLSGSGVACYLTMRILRRPSL